MKYLFIHSSHRACFPRVYSNTETDFVDTSDEKAESYSILWLVWRTTDFLLCGYNAQVKHHDLQSSIFQWVDQLIFAAMVV